MSSQPLLIVRVVIPDRKLDYLDYLPPTIPFPLAQGMRVGVALGKQQLVGIVWQLTDQTSLPLSRLKPILTVIDEIPLFSQQWCDMIDWIAEYYFATRGEVLKAFLPQSFRMGLPVARQQPHYWLIDYHDLPTRLGTKQEQLIQYLVEFPGSNIHQLKQRGIASQTVKRLQQLKLIRVAYRPTAPPLPDPVTVPAPTLTSAQQIAVDAITAARGFSPCLLMGVTGSGKTEVYLRAISQVLARGQSVLVLVPEIGLTPQFCHRLSQRFCQPMVVWHSDLTPTERSQYWHWVMSDQVAIILGTRSAVMMPIPTLGLIIVDEEHDLSYRQQEGFSFSARDVAIKRAQCLQIPVVLGSATPSLEIYQHAIQGHYRHLIMPSKALEQYRTRYEWIDLRAIRLTEGMALPCLQQMQKVLTEGQQVMVYLNRRGYAPVWICHHCGWMADCYRCSAHLTVHRQTHDLQCHHCGFTRPLMQQCQQCGGQEMMPLGLGTERLSEFLTDYFPNYRVLRIDSNTASTKAKLTQQLAMIDAGEADIIVGTQMLAKGHHFSRLALVVVADGDAGLASQDFRAPERLAQSLLQVAGRAGREIDGQVLVQTHHPGHPLLHKLVEQGYGAVADDLLQQRRQYQWPPYSFLVLCRLKARRADLPETLLSELINQWQPPLVECLGPVSTPMPQRAGWFEMQLLLRSQQRKALHVAAIEGQRRLAKIIKRHGQGRTVVHWHCDPQQL